MLAAAHPDPAGRRGSARALLATAGACALASALALACLWARREPLRAEWARTIGVDSTVQGLHQWRRRARPPGVVGAVLFGDSLTICTWEAQMPPLVERGLARRSVRTAFVSAVHLAFRPINFYYLVNEVRAGAPRVAIVEVNLRMFSEHVLVRPEWRFVQLARMLSLPQAWRLRAVLAGEGVTQLDPPLYRLEDRLGLLYAADGLRLTAADALEHVGGRLGDAVGLARRDPYWHVARATEAIQTLDVRTARAEYGVRQADHPMAAALRALGEELRAGGAAVVFYVSPVNVDHLAEIGVREELALGERVEALRRAVGATPEEWVDLHAAVPAEGFRDLQNHMRPLGCEIAADRVSEAVARAVGS